MPDFARPFSSVFFAFVGSRRRARGGGRTSFLEVGFVDRVDVGSACGFGVNGTSSYSQVRCRAGTDDLVLGLERFPRSDRLWRSFEAVLGGF